MTFVDIVDILYFISHIHCLVSVCQPLIKPLLTYLLNDDACSVQMACRVVRASTQCDTPSGVSSENITRPTLYTYELWDVVTVFSTKPRAVVNSAAVGLYSVNRAVHSHRKPATVTVNETPVFLTSKFYLRHSRQLDDCMTLVVYYCCYEHVKFSLCPL